MEAYHSGDYRCARGIGADVFTQGTTFEELSPKFQEFLRLERKNIPVEELFILRS